MDDNAQLMTRHVAKFRWVTLPNLKIIHMNI